MATRGIRFDFYLVELFGAGDGLAGDFFFEFFNGRDVLVDDRLIQAKLPSVSEGGGIPNSSSGSLSAHHSRCANIRGVGSSISRLV